MNIADYQPVGIDALELYAARHVNFTREFDDQWRKLATRGVGADDLRKVGLPAVMIHPHPQSGKKGTRTLQFKNVGNMDAAAIQATAAQIFETDPLELWVRRVDFTADLRGGSTISQIRACLQVQKKRKYVEYINPNRSGGMYETQRHDGGQLETLYYGDLKSDCLRIYDKAAEIAKRNRQRRNRNTDSWLRFERVLIHDAIPAHLNTLGKLLESGRYFDPFWDVQISDFYDITIQGIFDLPGYPLNQKENAAFAWSTCQNYGRSEAIRRIKAENRQPEDMLPLMERLISRFAVRMPSPADLTKIYRGSFMRQMFGGTQIDDDSITSKPSGGNLPAFAQII